MRLKGRKTIPNLKFDKEITALIVIDPYNDFISDGGKIWDRIKGVAEANNCVPNMLRVVNASRNAGLRVFYAMHRRYRPGDYETWKYIAPIQKRSWSSKVLLSTAHGVAISAANSPRNPAILSLRNIGVQAASPIPIWICCSRSTVFISSLSSDS